MSSIHDPSDIRVFHKECRSLAAAGFDVTLIARAETDGEVDGVRVVSVPASARNRFLRMTKTVWDVFRKARAERADLYHVHAVELLPAALALKALGHRVVYDVHEHFPDLIRSKYYLPAMVRPAVAAGIDLLEHFAARWLDGIVAATPTIAARFPHRKTVLINNFAMASEFRTGAATEGRGRSDKVAYVGSISEERGLMQMIDAIERVNAGGPATLVLGGPYAPATLRNEASRRRGWRHVEDLGWLTREQVARVLEESRAGLLVLLPVPNHVESMPNKLFEYMAAGLPMITSDFPYWRQFVSEIGCGLMVDPTDPAAIADAIAWMLNHPEEAEAMGARGRAAFEARFTWEREAERLIEFYRDRVLV